MISQAVEQSSVIAKSWSGTNEHRECTDKAIQLPIIALLVEKTSHAVTTIVVISSGRMRVERKACLNLALLLKLMDYQIMEIVRHFLQITSQVELGEFN